MKHQPKALSILIFILFSFAGTAQNSFINFYNINPIPGSISLDKKDLLELSNGDIVFTVYDEEVCSVIKTDNLGNLIWGKKLSENWVLEPAQIIELNNNDILIVGRIRDLIGSFSEDIAVVNFSSTGELNWSKRIDEPDLTSVITKVSLTADENILITGIHDLSYPGGFDTAEGYVAKMNNSGEIIQRKVISTGNYTTFSHVQELENNNIILFGEGTSSQGSSRDLVLILLDSNLDQIWSKTIYFNDSASPFENHANSAVDFEVVDDEFLISAAVLDPAGYYSVILNLDSEANVVYSKRFTVGNEDLYHVNFIVNQNNEAVFFGGYATKLVKINVADGSMIWSKELVTDDFGLGIKQFTENNEILFKSGSQNTITIGKIDSDLSNCLAFQSTDYSDTAVTAYIEDVNLTITDEAGTLDDFTPFEIEDLSPNTSVFCSEVVNVSTLNAEYDVNIYPNPTERNLYVSGFPENSSIHILDFAGKRIASWNNPTESNFEINFSDLPKGIYLISVENEGTIIFSEKVVKVDR